ncbi:LLM class flavin-dependent oxidoreductase [Pedobacter polysacchareus]|uniref:LLM class flavin-dependent oxidoreductase n=1 Tax=Pedobacter polysacchareus TaxID=2861973 RepID=UPI001C99CD96|nr:LLM class flavin-dependent oxidoreductase [Pedobacter polysacchareus]
MGKLHDDRLENFMVLKEEIELSVLDFGETINPNESVHEVLNYAVIAEELGFKRFWLGEHYLNHTLFSNPEPLIPTIALKTKRIAVGVAGILIRQHSTHRVSYSFNLLARMFPDRIDLGLVAPSIKADVLQQLSSNDRRGAQEIFQEFIDLFNGTAKAPGIHINSSPNLWHLTSSIKTYVSCQHHQAVNVSKTLFHHNANFDPEIDVMNRLKDRNENGHIPKINIAIGCFVSYDHKKVSECRKFYKSILSKEVYDMSVIETPNSFLEKIKSISHKYQTNDIVILNLGRSYQDKAECLTAVSDILNLKDAYKFR